MAHIRPSVFVGSSTEGLPIAKAIQVLLDRDCEVELWTQGVFGLSEGTLESLVLALQRFDFAVLVLTADDVRIRRGERLNTARDNVVFELGLFVGGLGRDRTFMVFDRTTPPDLPSDLAGITAATFAPHATGNHVAALGAACTQIQTRVSTLGLRDEQRVKQLSNAAASVQGTSGKMAELTRLLARSRMVELDIISRQFGMFIDPKPLRDLQRDLEDFERTLREDGSDDG